MRQVWVFTTIPHRILAYGNDSGECHDRQNNTSGQSGLAHRQIKDFLNKRYDDYQPKETVDHGRNTTEQFNNYRGWFDPQNSTTPGSVSYIYPGA